MGINEDTVQGIPPAEFCARWREFDGSDLYWEVLYPSYAGLRMRVEREGSVVGRLQFMYPLVLDCPTIMSRVSLRTAEPVEADCVMSLIGKCKGVKAASRSALYRSDSTLVAIHHTAGTSFIWAHLILYVSADEEVPEWAFPWPGPSPFGEECG